MSTVIPYRNPMALAAYYGGVFGVVPCAVTRMALAQGADAIFLLAPLLGVPMALASVLLGAAGLNRRRTRPGARGQLHAWVGMVLGVAEMVAYFVFFHRWGHWPISGMWQA